MKASLDVEVPICRTARVMQVESLFDIPPADRAKRSWEVDLPIEDREWNIGLIVGPSGAGKSRVARKLFGDAVLEAFDWSDDQALVDAFPQAMPIKDITGLLGAVGLGSTPAWLRPYGTLSTGEQFRANVARALAEQPELAVIDEWTSTVDRQVGKVASAAAAKAVRKRHQHLVAITCHYDVEDWLQPDWVYQPHTAEFTWRSVQPRPQVRLDIFPMGREAWSVFRVHHYLTAGAPYGRYYGGFVGDECVAFAIVAGTPHGAASAKLIRRARRIVVLPDWQGLGIGTRFEDYLAQRYVEMGYRFRSVTAHPGFIRHYMRSPRWRFEGKVGLGSSPNRSLLAHYAEPRMLQVRCFEYQPPAGTFCPRKPEPGW